MRKADTMILLVTLDFPPLAGGIGTHSHLLAKYSNRKIVVLAPSCKGAKNFDKTQNFETIRMKLIDMHIFYRIGARLLLVDALILLLVAVYVFFYAVKLKPKNLYLSHWILALATLPTSKLLRIPYYFAAHGTEIVKRMKNSVFKALFFLCVGNVRRVICLANFQRTILAKEGVSADKLSVFSGGTDIQLFRPIVDISELAEKFNLGGKEVILTVGRLVKRKGHDMVIKSLPRVLEHVSNALYVIVGEGPELENLKSLVQKLNLKRNVIFAGYVPSEDLPKYYNACDVFIMASREVNGDVEGFGIVYLEANACSKPVIAGSSGGTGSAVKHGVNGFLVDPLNVDEIANYITLLLTDKKLAEEIGSRGRQRVERDFDFDLVAKEILNIMENAV